MEWAEEEEIEEGGIKMGCLGFCLTALITGCSQVPIILCTGLAMFISVVGATLGADVMNAASLLLQQTLTGSAIGLTNICGGA